MTRIIMHCWWNGKKGQDLMYIYLMYIYPVAQEHLSQAFTWEQQKHL